jgi:hypothetical protein
MSTAQQQVTMEKAVEQRISEGWDWVEWCVDVICLMPPKGDSRWNWCAEWVPYIGNKVIPHWAIPTNEDFYKIKNEGAK